MPYKYKDREMIYDDLKFSNHKNMGEEKPNERMDLEKDMDMKENINIEKNMMARKNLMVHLEFECGMEEQPRPCIKIPISLDAAVIALIVTNTENC